MLAGAAATDPQIDSLAVDWGASEPMCYLQTSPEFGMKRLLAAGSGAIYYLGKAFRREQIGRRHNPEFTLLEWYRPGFDEQRLMDEVEALVVGAFDALCVPPPAVVERVSYREVFQRVLGVDPHTAALETLQNLARRSVEINWDDSDRDIWLDLLMTHVIEPELGSGLTFIYDYPASQAALAKIETDASGQPVARRFEVYCHGMELANGYWELTDADEQQRRFNADLRRRRQRGQVCAPSDQRLLRALQAGIPETAGVALGVDRLLMLLTGAEAIADVLAFPFNRA